MSDVEKLKTTMERYSARGCAIGLCFYEGNPAWSYFSYAPDFLQRYQDENLAHHDLTLSKGFAEDGVFVWSDLERSFGPSLAMQVAAAYGMRDGICFSETVNGFKSIASISFTSSDEISAVPVQEIYDRFKLAALEVTKASNADLVSRETREYLTLVSEGMTDEQISQRIQITIHGVRRRRRQAIQHLEANSLPHAIYKALLMGAISPYQKV